MRIAVIGAGIAGLAVSARLSANGHSVVVYEKNQTYGGKMTEHQKDGFYFDGGPSFFTDPPELERLFSDCGVGIEQYFSYFRTGEACRYFFENNILLGYDRPDELAKELDRVFGEPERNTRRFLRDSDKIFSTIGSEFLNHQFPDRSTLNPKLIHQALNVPIAFYVTHMHSLHKLYFHKPDTVRFFDRFATYVGAHPMRAPALLSAMPALEHVQGAYQPHGGMRAIPKSVYDLSKKLGTTFMFGERIDHIMRVERGYRLHQGGKGHEQFDMVVNAGDIAQFYSYLGDKTRYKKEQNGEPSSSALVLYLGVKKLKKELYLHNIFFADNYEAETYELWGSGNPYPDPTIYINYTGYYEKDHAPKNHQNLFIMINVPAGSDAHYIKQARNYVIQKLKRVCDEDIENKIVYEAESLTPSRIEKNFNAYKGAIYGRAANSIRSAFLRPRCKDSYYPGIYHCGVTVHPGGGIPLALRSAKIVAQMIG